jgi:hypothetical protein
VAGQNRAYVDQVMGAVPNESAHAPEAAEASISSWWAGGGVDFYAVQGAGGVVSVFARWEDEMDEGSAEWELFRRLDPAGSAPYAAKPGRYCYSFDDGIRSIRIDLAIASDGSVTGRREDDFSDDENDYYESSMSTLSGTYTEGLLRLQRTRHQDGETFESTIVWPLRDAGVEVDGQLADSCAAAASLCEATEQAYFSCRIDGGDALAALCGSVGATETSGYVQYRFGTPGNVIDTFPPELADSRAAFEWGTTMYSGGWDTRVRFEMEGQEHQLYDRAIKVSMSEKDWSAGLLVGSGDAAATRECASETSESTAASIRLNQVVGVVPAGTFMDDL